MEDIQQLAFIRKGVEDWNAWRKENPNARVDLSEAYLFDADPSDADLNGANLREGLLIDAPLIGTIFSGTNLTDAKLSRGRS